MNIIKPLKLYTFHLVFLPDMKAAGRLNCGVPKWCPYHRACIHGHHNCCFSWLSISM